MQQMMELAKPGENHKHLAQLSGNWTYTVTMWMDVPHTSHGCGGASKCLIPARDQLIDNIKA